MGFFTKESLERLKQSIDLVEVISAHIDLKRAGASHKALCPFHDEKTSSFVVQRGDSHYHCYGCGAHGDAIQFLMEYLKMDFQEAVESLAERFHVHLEKEEASFENKGPSKESLKKALEEAQNFYNSFLLESPAGRPALDYLAKRGIDKEFITHFKIGLSPRDPSPFKEHMKKEDEEVLLESGLIRKDDKGRVRDFFSDRIMFPIKDPMGSVIGFSARKYKEETFGGKYINTSETRLFKKSQVLFGLSYCRRRIAKERKTIIVEGQIDTLRLIYAGFDTTLAAQGTAFGEGHVTKLKHLGVNTAYIAFDSDKAGMIAARKAGSLLQKEGIGVYVIRLPQGEDPDSFLQKEGKKAFSNLLENGEDYLSFLVKSGGRHLQTPAGKHAFATNVADQIRTWNHPVMVHESLRKLASLLKIPETSLGVGSLNSVYIKRSENVGQSSIDPNKATEGDLLRWLFLMGESRSDFVEMAKENIQESDFRVEIYRDIYERYLQAFEERQARDILGFMSHNQDFSQAIEEILRKKVNRDRAEAHFIDTIQRILDRNWLEAREKINVQIQSGNHSEQQQMELIQEFDRLREQRPFVKLSKSLNTVE